jgi:RNA polymerase sigma factor (sigma-70 family)
MSSPTTPWDSDGIARCQQGDPAALGELRNKFQTPIFQTLVARGATRTEADDLLADLWADCVPGADDRPSLLGKFNGKSTLQGWLMTVATNRWIDFKRRGAKQVDLSGASSAGGSSGSEQDVFDRMPGSQEAPKEDTLTALLRDCVKAGFAACSPEAMVLLRLVYLHELTQREVVRMLGWSESKVSRFLTSALEQIENRTLREVKKRDPWLELSWQDFVDLCETYQVSFL